MAGGQDDLLLYDEDDQHPMRLLGTLLVAGSRMRFQVHTPTEEVAAEIRRRLETNTALRLSWLNDSSEWHVRLADILSDPGWPGGADAYLTEMLEIVE